MRFTIWYHFADQKGTLGTVLWSGGLPEWVILEIDSWDMAERIRGAFTRANLIDHFSACIQRPLVLQNKVSPCMYTVPLCMIHRVLQRPILSWHSWTAPQFSCVAIIPFHIFHLHKHFHWSRISVVAFFLSHELVTDYQVEFQDSHHGGHDRQLGYTYISKLEYDMLA